MKKIQLGVLLIAVIVFSFIFYMEVIRDVPVYEVNITYQNGDTETLVGKDHVKVNDCGCLSFDGESRCGIRNYEVNGRE